MQTNGGSGHQVDQERAAGIEESEAERKVSKTPSEFKDLQRLIDIINNGKRLCMTSMIGEDGVENG